MGGEAVKAFAVIIVISLLTGCAESLAVSKATTISNSQLCSVLVKPTSTAEAKNRAERVLASRGEDCAAYSFKQQDAQRMRPLGGPAQVLAPP